MLASPLVSVIIPAHNAEGTIEGAVTSVLAQTTADLELIVVDDASTDGTAGSAERSGDARVRVIRSSRILRPSAARNLGIRQSSGRWLAFLDADDQWVPDRLEHLIDAAGGEEECFVADLRAECVPDRRGSLTPLRPLEQTPDSSVDDLDFLHYLELGMDVKPIVTRASLVRHGIEFPEWGSGGDWAFLIAQLSIAGVKGKLLPRVGYLYRASGSRHDSSTLRSAEEHLLVVETLAADPRLPEAARARLRERAEGRRRRLVAAAAREGNWQKFTRYASQNPGGVLELVPRALSFALRKARHLRAVAPRAAVESRPRG